MVCRENNTFASLDCSMYIFLHEAMNLLNSVFIRNKRPVTTFYKLSETKIKACVVTSDNNYLP
jgi:hypothetical protein